MVCCLKLTSPETPSVQISLLPPAACPSYTPTTHRCVYGTVYIPITSPPHLPPSTVIFLAEPWRRPVAVLVDALCLCFSEEHEDEVYMLRSPNLPCLFVCLFFCRFLGAHIDSLLPENRVGEANSHTAHSLAPIVAFCCVQ